MEWLLVLLGLVILLFAGDALVKGAVNLSLRLGVPALIVSLTIVAFGTSAPELLIAVSAIYEGAPGLALGNVVGSNTANVLLVLGVPALVAGLNTGACETRKSYGFIMVATALFAGLCFFGPLMWWHGLILLGGLAYVLSDAFREAAAHRKASQEAEAVEGADPDMRKWKIAAYLVAGLIGLPLGAELLVRNAVLIAEGFGVSETVIGLTLVAVGTSLPELATTVMAALRKQADVALGNVIGSNMFNLLAIMGIASLVGEIPVAESILRFDLWVMVLASVLLAPFVLKGWNMTRPWGFALVGLYVVYIGFVLS